MPYPYSKYLFSEDHELFRETARRFIAAEVEPYADEWRRAGRMPRSFWKKAGEARLLALGVPEEYGGPGGDFLYRVIMAQEIGYSVAGASISAGFERDQMSNQFMDHASELLKRRWVPGIANGEIQFSFAITEPDIGSDVSALRTTAVREGEDYVINGSKTYISGASTCDAALVACKTDPDKGNKGISVIVVEADRAGFRRGRKLEKMGMHGSDTGELFFDNVRVPASNLFGAEHGGFRVLMSSLNRDRLTWSVIAHAAAQRAFDETVEFVKNRKSFGQHVFDHQNTQFRLAEMKTELAVGSAFLDETIRMVMEGSFDGVRSAMVKMWLPEMENRVIDQCVQLHGGAGYMEEYPVSKLYTAARLHRIFAGTAEIMRLLVARSI
jgi:alkylation response protein AidB-like acyl-CoA dehydrogenase